MTHVLVTGSTGLLGSTLVPYLRDKKHFVETNSRDGYVDCPGDLSNRDAAFEILNKSNPEIIINLVGLTDVDLCESSPGLAYEKNVKIVDNIAQWIENCRTKCHFIQISTDQIYDGVGPHLETNILPKNYYAFSKYCGELIANAVSSTVLRTNFFGLSQCTQRKSLTDWLFESFRDNKKIQVFSDVLFSPLSIKTLVVILERVMDMKPIGVFNLGSINGCSKAEFAFKFASELGFSDLNMSQIRISEAGFIKAYRPKDMRMNCERLEHRLEFKLPTLDSEIKKVSLDYL